MEKYAVIFDLDGTLLNTLPDLTDSVNFVLERHGLKKRGLGEVRSFVGNGAAKLVERAIYSGSNVDPESTEAKEFTDLCLNEFKEHYGSHAIVRTCAYEGISELVERLFNMGVRLAVVSNKPDPVVKSLCRHFFGEKIGIAIGDSDKFPRKPSPDSIFYTMRQLECQKTVYVGDSDVDIVVAKNANIPCVTVSWGFKDKDFLIAHGAARIADTAEQLFEQLVDILK